MDSLQTAVRTLLIYIALGVVLPSPLAWAGPPATDESTDQRCGGEPCAAVFRGLFAFFDRDLRGLDGNGRSCADCHMATEHFRLTPAAVEARFQFLQKRRRHHPNADDPLFRPIDADDFRSNGARASDYSNLRQNGLVRIVFALPSSIRLVDPVTNQPSDETSVDIWRMVPGVTDLKLTGADGANPWPRGPNPSGGYQLDGRVLTLQDQALGALLNHAQVHNPPPQRLLDDLSSFQRVLVTSPEPPLNALEQQGKSVFTRSCAQCHGGAGQSTTQPPVVRYHDISSQCPRPVDAVTPARWNFQACLPRLARNARTYEITLPTGAKIRRVSSDPGRALLTGFAGVGPPATDDWNKLDVTGLRELRNTAPYFHNNSAATLEEVVDHYIEFYKRVQAIAPPGVVPPVASTDGLHFDRIPLPEERAALLAYLRKL
jgi:cytochrome c peroxidase